MAAKKEEEIVERIVRLVALVGDGSDEEKLGGMRELIEIAEVEENRLKIVVKKALPKIVACLEIDKVKNDAIVALTKLSEGNVRTKKKIGECGEALAKIVNCLQDDVLRNVAVKAISTLVYECDENRIKVGLMDKVFEPLVSFLKAKHPDSLRASSAHALGNLAFAFDDSRKKIAQIKDSIDLLVECTKSQNDLVREEGLRALTRLSRNKELNEKIRNYQGLLENVISMLNKELPDELRIMAAAAIGHFASDSLEIAEKVFKMETPITILLDLSICDTTSTLLKFMAIAALAHIIYHTDEIRHAVVMKNNVILPKLIEYVTISDNEDIRRMSAVAIGHFAKTLDIRLCLLELGAVGALDVLRGGEKGFSYPLATRVMVTLIHGPGEPYDDMTDLYVGEGEDDVN